MTLLGLASIYGGFLRPWRQAQAGVANFALSAPLAAFGVAFTLLGIGLLLLGARFQTLLGIGPGGQKLTKAGWIFTIACVLCALGAHQWMISVFRDMGYDTTR